MASYLPNQQHMLSASTPNWICSLQQQSRFRRALMPSRTSRSSSHHGICPSDGVIQTLCSNVWLLCKSTSLIGREVGNRIAYSGSYNCSSCSQYLLNLWIADISAGWRFAIAFRVCWWSFMPIQMFSLMSFNSYKSSTNRVPYLCRPPCGLACPIQKNFLSPFCEC